MTKHRADRAGMIMHFITEYQVEHGFSPSVREIAKGVGLASPSAAQHHLAKLRQAGMLDGPAGLSRGIKIESLTAQQIELAWCLSVHGSRKPKSPPCSRHHLMAEWLAEVVLPKARLLAVA